ncbi:MAG: PA14 domain-containing protein [Lentisphaeraceae bacterium]|nr:PA14 domain-containing protein [Lentisphaeraceae bacterium]
MKNLRQLSFLLLLASLYPLYAGGLNREIYEDLPGHDIGSIRNNPKFQTAPDFYDLVPIYESPQSYGDNYGTYIRGYITVPEDGDYTFYFSSDDKGELYLSTDDNEVNKAKIASVSGWSGYRTYDKYESQTSQTFTFTAGQVLYTEAFAKEGGGGDHLTVAWSINGGEIEVISGDYLTPFHNNFDEVQQQLSLAISTAETLYTSSAANIGTDLGQYTEASRIVFLEAINIAKGVHETEETSAHKLYVTLKAIEEQTEKFDGGLKAVKLYGKVFGALPTSTSSWLPENAFDGNVGTGYHYLVPDNGFVGIDLGAGNETAITGIRFFPRLGLGKRMRSNKFQGSIDGANYVDLYTITDSPEDTWHTVEVTDTTAYRYYRYYDVAGYSGWGNIAEIEFLGVQNQELYMQNLEFVSFIASTLDQVITSDSVKAEHGGLPAQFITYKVLELPLYGTLNLSGSALVVDSTFTQEDIDNNLVTFNSDDSHKNTSFKVEVSDTIGGLIDEVIIDIIIDTDGDGLSDEDEVALGTDYTKADTDGDGLLDGWEKENSLDPLENTAEPFRATIEGENGLTALYNYGRFNKTTDFSNGSPAAVNKVSNINFAPTYWGEFANSGAVHDVGARFKGYLFVPVEGNYEFFLSSDDGSKLFIDGIEAINIDGQHGFKQGSHVMNLSEGFHKIQVDYFEASGNHGCILQWEGPGRARQIIPSSFFYLSPQEHEVDVASIDRDNDGLVDTLEETEGTDPDNPDSDGDRLLDGEEYHAMYNYKTNPLSVDTDGDTVSDYDEIFVFHSNPLVPDFDGTIVDSITIIPSETSTRLGEWTEDGDEIYANKRRGYLEYKVMVPVPGLYRFDIGATQNISGSKRPNFDLHLYVDEEFVGRQEQAINFGETKTYSFLSTNLRAGQHTIRIFWDNIYEGTSLRVKSLELSKPGGPDENGNGQPDWVDSYIQSVYSLNAHESISKVSPAQLEGKGRYLSKFLTSFSEPIQHSTYNRWFVDLNLSKSGPTDYAIEYEHGLNAAVGQITWSETNVLDEGEMTVRQNASMLLNAVIDGVLDSSTQLTITRNDESAEVFDSAPESPHEYKFTESGTYMVKADYADAETTLSKTLTVHVVGVPEVDAPFIWRGKPRFWEWPNLSESVELEAFGMGMTETADGIEISRNEILEQINIVARLGSGGPIISSLPTKAFWLRDVTNGVVNIVETYDDGAIRTQDTVIAYGLPEEMIIKVNTISGVTFMTGSRYMDLSKNNFNELNLWTMELLRTPDRAGSMCHWYKVHQNSVFVGQQNK